MVEIIKKNYERIDWVKKINSVSPAEAKKWQVQEYLRVQGDKEYWFRNYVWTIDARKTPSIIPFILYDYQVDLIKQLDKFMDTFIDKSRQMGVSWVLMGWQLHHAMYTKGFTSLNISRKESEVQDAGNTHHSLFGRLKFIYDRMPPFLRPTIHNPFLTLRVPAMNSIIKGESSNPKAGRGGQYKFILIDEAAHIDCLDEMWKGVRSASNSVCLNSTPPENKVNNKFAEIQQMKSSGFCHMRFHWSQHPEYTQEWYAKKTASMTEQEIAQELEISYDASLTRTSYPEFKNDVHIMSRKVYLNPKAPLYCFMDFGLGGEVFLFAQKDGLDRIFFIYYQIFKNKLTPELYAEFIKCLAHINYTGAIKDIIFVGDKSGTKRSRTSKTTVIEEYYTVSNGAINIQYKSTLTNEEKMRDMKSCLKHRFPEGQPQFNVSKEESCLRFAEAMRCIQLSPRGDDHVDNDYTHVVNAAEYGISFLFPRKKAELYIAGIDSGQEISDKYGKTRTVDSPISKMASATAVIGNYRIERKGVIY